MVADISTQLPTSSHHNKASYGPANELQILIMHHVVGQMLTSWWRLRFCVIYSFYFENVPWNWDVRLEEDLDVFGSKTKLLQIY